MPRFTSSQIALVHNNPTIEVATYRIRNELRIPGRDAVLALLRAAGWEVTPEFVERYARADNACRPGEDFSW